MSKPADIKEWINSADLLQFDATRGEGYFPVTDRPYDQAYFDKYVTMGQSVFGIALNSLRAGLVSRYLDGSAELIDIGVGDGAFIRERGASTWGYDVNPAAVTMLRDSSVWCDIYEREILANVTFWDSLEHIEQPGLLIRKVRDYCFISIPVFRDREHIMHSKHFRPTEHFWYYTIPGLIYFFRQLQFGCIEINDMETALGREDIRTFVFRRKS